MAFGPSCSSSALRFLEGLKDEEGTEDAEDVAAFLGAKNEFIMSWSSSGVIEFFGSSFGFLCGMADGGHLVVAAAGVAASKTRPIEPQQDFQFQLRRVLKT